MNNDHQVENIISDFYNNENYDYFKVIKTFLPIVISEDYRRKIPLNFFEEIFSSCPDELIEIPDDITEEELIDKRKKYLDEIESLNGKLKDIINNYAGLYWSNKNNVFPKSKIITRNELPEHTEEYGEIIYDEITSVTERIKDQHLVLNARDYITIILYKLNDLSKLCNYFDKENNSYRKFASDIITRMYGNVNQRYPRSIINYTAFQFCLDGYPYNTKSERIYSISNITNKTKNKFELIEIFDKNIEAVINFLHDLEWSEKNSDNTFDFELETLKNAFGTCIALCAFIGEQECYRETLTNSLDGSLIDCHSSIGSIFFNRINKRFNEVHE